MKTRALAAGLLLSLAAGAFGPSAATAREHRPRPRRPPSRAQPPSLAELPVDAEEAGADVEVLTVEALAPWNPPSDGRPTATTLFAAGGLAPEAESQVLAVFVEVLGSDRRLHYRDATEVLEPRERVEEAIASADGLLQEARRAFDQLDLELAGTRAAAALAIYRRHLPALSTMRDGIKRVREVWTRLAAVRFLAGDHDGASNALRHAFVFGTSLDPGALPPQMKKLVVERSAMFEALGQGRIFVDSSPAGAAVYINGAVRGLTPLNLDDLPPGPNSLTLVRRGYLPGLVDVEVAGGAARARVDVDLTRFDDDPFAAATRAKDALGVPIMPEPLQRAAARLHVDLLLALVPEQGEGRIGLAGWLFDARTRTLSRHAVRSGPSAQLPETARLLAADLLRGARSDGAAAAPVKEAGAPRSRAFWPLIGSAIGLAVVGAAVGITLGALAAQPTPMSPGEQVILLGLSPRR